MKKTIGIILMVISALFFVLLMASEVLLAKEGSLPTNVFEWIGNLLLPAVCVGVFFLGNSLRKK